MLGMERRSLVKDAAMKGAPTKPRRGVPALDMGLRSKNAVMTVAITTPRRGEVAIDMGQSALLRRNAATKDVPTKLKREESVVGMEQSPKYAVTTDAPT